MKKGDLVKLKEGKFWGSKDGQRMGFKDNSEIPEYLEVIDIGFVIACCTPVFTFQVQFGDKVIGLWQEDFEVALPANELNVDKLMRETKEMELLTLGF